MTWVYFSVGLFVGLIAGALTVATLVMHGKSNEAEDACAKEMSAEEKMDYIANGLFESIEMQGRLTKKTDFEIGELLHEYVLTSLPMFTAEEDIAQEAVERLQRSTAGERIEL